jgi:SAM-dependent methyltransferase
MNAFGLRFWELDKNLFAATHPSAACYSDGQREEDHLWEIVRSASDLSSCSWELDNAARSWVEKYHCSVHRGAIIRCLPFSSEKRVLELGAGAGAITRALGERFVVVDAVEGSFDRARICARRCSDLSNVRVFAADIGEINPEPEYDLVFLIGVLEWSKGFIGGNDPFQRCLSIASRSLKPDGQLVVAIENQIGLKYFLGSGEDHCGIPMEGLEGYPNFDKAETFSRLKLIQMLETAGFPYARLLYPFPDYKLAKTVLTDEAVSLCSGSIAYWASRHKFEDYQVPDRYHYGNQILVAAEIAKAGLIGELSNSFLVIAGKNAEIDYPSWLVWSERLTRNPHLCSTTTLESVCDTLVVKKCFPQRTPPETSMNEVAYGLNSIPMQPFFDGTSLEIELLRCAIAGRRSDFIRIVVEWMSYVEKHFKPADRRSVQPAAWDCIPRNMVRLANGEITAFDLEFINNREFTLEQLCTRGLICWFCDHAPWSSSLYPEAVTIREKILLILKNVFPSMDGQRVLNTVIGSETEFQEWAYRTGTLDIESMLNAPIRRGDFGSDVAERLRVKENEVIQLRQEIGRLQLFSDTVRQTWAYRMYRQFVKPFRNR